MIVSWNWLTDYVRLDMPVEKLTDRLALTGLNHESTADVGGDLAIDLEVTSNRSDCLGHLGVAREISVLFGKSLCIPAASPPTTGAAVESRTAVEVEAVDVCSRFTARVISGVKVAESPWWLRRRLETLGVRPISNIVDVTNYVMFECGQPLHAYDLNRLEERRLVVRRALPGEKLTAINGRVYELEPSMLVIADAVRPVGLAGVMGGLDTEIGAGTTDVLIEAAQFDALSIRKTARALGLFSPSSFRFERPLDPEAAEWASRRCAELILELAGGSLHPGVIDVGRPKPAREPVSLRFAQIPRVLGIAVDRPEVRTILSSLGLEIVGESDASITVRPPSWRADLDREIDLIEEVARIHGYEHIPEDRAVPVTSAPRGRRERVESEIRNVLTGLGLDEAATFSLVEDSLAAPIEPGPASAPLRVDHSSRRRENALRQSLIPSLLAARRHNEAHGAADAQLFEIADVYLPREGRELPDEPPRLALAAGRDFRGLKGVVESLITRLHVAEPLSARPVESALFAPGRAAELRVGDVHLGYLGEIDAGQLERFELRGACAAAELDLNVLLDKAQLVPKARPLPSFPAVVRDLSLVVDRSLAWADLAAVVSESAGNSFRAIEYLDAFQGGNLADDQQSLHFGMTFRRDDRTLTGEEVDLALKNVIEACSRKFGAKLRG
ncbi:MAG: phenylalanine--tRNA ligase subunit beta [Paludisphaera borealis]|uniref:phenylalanine--tRNA ligase subunit beta n=1 Tax=Paludisphaera borealis TaxID=1387353 RepID=UPI0028462C97|nr:phenylalanine--tRNA ligase subunit beta [Paludisphaera borealis]MDR3621331.1 phenylalanine--tRNA ligase subunit beta [Paludisphaera borealis]